MKTCPYCGSSVAGNGSGMYYCGFCDMKGITPVEDGKRESRFQIKPFISHDDLKKSTPELMTYNTVDLLKLLKLGREERRQYFGHVTTFKRAGNETDQFKAVEVQTGNDYEAITRKVWVIENILKERIGYIPNRVTDQLLMTVQSRVDSERNLKPMTIKKNPEMSMER